jgi:hypothetical protein
MALKMIIRRGGMTAPVEGTVNGSCHPSHPPPVTHSVTLKIIRRGGMNAPVEGTVNGSPECPLQHADLTPDYLRQPWQPPQRDMRCGSRLAGSGLICWKQALHNRSPLSR